TGVPLLEGDELAGILHRRFQRYAQFLLQFRLAGEGLHVFALEFLRLELGRIALQERHILLLIQRIDLWLTIVPAAGANITGKILKGREVLPGIVTVRLSL